MITYEKARELKDAGFPQTMVGPMYYCSDLNEWTYSRNCEPYEGRNCGNHEIIKNPTLSELIEECGDKFWSVQQNGTNQWVARDDSTEFYTKASTPEEAVVNLWLELNKK